MTGIAEAAMEKPLGRKLLSPQERMDLVLLALAKEQSLEQLCSQAGVSKALVYRWMHQMRDAGLKALEAKKPGRRPRVPEKAEDVQKLKERLEALEKEAARLRKERDHQELLAQTAQRIIRRRGWEEPAIKKNGSRRRRGGATLKTGQSNGVSGPQQGSSPDAGESAAPPTGAGPGAR